MNIFLTRRAGKNYRSIKEYITNDWGKKVVEVFEQKTINFLDLFQSFPEMGEVEVIEKQIRGFQLTRQTRVFYRIKGERIIILTFFDVRQNPKKKPW